LILSQALTLYITPVIYVYLDRAGKWAANGQPGRLRGGEHSPAPAE